MVILTDIIINALASESFTYSPEIRDFYSPKKPKYPMITVDEIDNITLQTLANGVESLSQVRYKFEIYAKDKLVNSEPVSARTIINQTAVELDEIMRTKFGLVRMIPPIVIPYEHDNTAMRNVMVYGGELDTRTLYIYQNR